MVSPERINVTLIDEIAVWLSGPTNLKVQGQKVEEYQRVFRNCLLLLSPDVNKMGV